MDALGSVQAEEFGRTEEKAEVWYTDYWTAEKLVETITGDMNMEVSDSEAKVISVAQIQVSDRTRAEEIRSKIQEEGMDFFAAAKEYSEDPEKMCIRDSLKRGGRDPVAGGAGDLHRSRRAAHLKGAEQGENAGDPGDQQDRYRKKG